MVVMTQGNKESNTQYNAFNEKHLHLSCWGGRCSGGGDDGGAAGGFLHNRAVA